MKSVSCLTCLFSSFMLIYVQYAPNWREKVRKRERNEMRMTHFLRSSVINLTAECRKRKILHWFPLICSTYMLGGNFHIISVHFTSQNIEFLWNFYCRWADIFENYYFCCFSICYQLNNNSAFIWICSACNLSYKYAKFSHSTECEWKTYTKLYQKI